LKDVPGHVIVMNCSSTEEIPLNQQWIYNSTYKSFRTALDGRCLTIENCSGIQNANVIVSKCHIDESQALCQSKNQLWAPFTAKNTFVSLVNGKWSMFSKNCF